MNLHLSSVATLALAASSLWAQGGGRGTLVGTISDPTGSVIAEVKIAVTNVATGLRYFADTDATGNYAVPGLPVGNYRIEAESAGFKTAAVVNLRLETGATLRANIRLEVGDIASQVTVTGTPSLLKTDSSDVSHVVEQRRIVDLPLNGRDFQQLQLLTPGSVSTRNFQTDAGGGGGAATVSLSDTLNTSNGSRPGSQLFLLDGGNASNRQARSLTVTPSIDEIEEFRVAGSNFSAEFGYGTNVINVSTKAGTNTFHGGLREFLRNDALAARGFFDRSVAVLKRNQFGGSLGGPIRKDRSFFFVTYEGKRQRTTNTVLATVPTQRMRTGDLSELPFQIFDPATSRLGTGNVIARDPFPGKVIPRNRLDDVSQLFLEWVPLPNTAGITGNFRNEPRVIDDYNHVTVRLDHKLTSKDSLSGRWTHHPATGFLSVSPYSGFSKNNYSPNTIFKNTTGISAVATWIHVFSPVTLLEVRPSYSSPILKLDSPDVGIDWTARAGIQGFGSGISDAYPTYPSFAYTGYAGLPNSLGGANVHHSRDLVGNVTLVRGSHIIKTGSSFASFHQGVLSRGFGAGAFSYNGSYTSNPSMAGASGNSLGDYLLGIPFTAARFAPPGKFYLQMRNFWNYVQDDWKLTRNLTLNLGLRYELNFPTTEKFDQMASFQAGPRNGRGAIVITNPEALTANLHPSVAQSLPTYRPLITFAENVGLPGRSLRFTNYGQFAPRVGIAWRLREKLIVRAGYGLYWFQLDGNRENEYASAPFLIREQAVLNVVSPTGVPQRSTQTFFPKESTFSAQPQANGHDPSVAGFGSTSQWNLTIQRLFGSLSVEGAYVGTKGSHLQMRRNINAPTPGPGAIPARRPYPDFQNVMWNEQSASSIYHSFQSKVERRFDTGLSLLTGFTWSKTIDNSSESSQACTNSYNCRFDRGPSDFDVPLTFVASVVYDLPFFRGKSNPAALRHALGGWSVAAIVTLQSGFPLTPTWTGDVSNTGSPTRPKRICDGRLAEPTVAKWYDTGCFAAPDPFTFGTAGRNILRADSLENADLAIYKSFQVRENDRLQFRLETFNTLNHPNFAAPNPTINAAGAGQVLRSGPGRVVQLGLKYDF